MAQTYLDLWCRTWDDAFVVVSKPREMAYYSGFTGERAERTWAARIATLKELGFIDVQAGAHGSINYVLLFNPYQVVLRKYRDGSVTEADMNALRERVVEIGANEFDDD